jgi:predicted nucleic acid-binding protein
VVDSSAWLEYFTNGPGAQQFAGAIEDVERLVVPAVCVLEVFKIVLRERGENDALQAAALMQQGRVIDLDAPLALAAAKLGLAHKLPLADSVVYATAQLVGALVWTQDDDFEGLADVQYFRKRAR